MNILFVVPYPVGEAASQRFRVEQWLPLLEEQHIQYEVAPFWSLNAWNLLYKPGHRLQKGLGLLAGLWRRLLLLADLPRYDCIFLHREATPLGPPWFEWLAAKAFQKKIIYDFDDAIWLPSTSIEKSLVTKLKWRQKVTQICRWSHKVSCGNGFLQQFALQHNAASVLLPSVLDTAQRYAKSKVPKSGEPVVLGWIGSHSTLPYLQLIEPVLRRLEQAYAIKVVIVADKPPQLALQHMEFRRWQRETEVADLLQFDIGLMPLPDTAWAQGKCAFKALQYMALGIPAVVSGVGANTEVVQNGVTGYVCRTEQEWYGRLEELLRQPGLRAEMGEAGRAWVEAKYSLQAHRHTFLSLFS
ncbi:glycosyltransferase [Pontibacter sp. E15-1]|uniref:glycosyltransferase n=1 Tax=Pontibacter sp. E15-1 TaxID=2919918 RepID=UPI001F4F3458|nr:glycosyltransferase [Pontibacter sp. E15-1]MCJ8165803.1 glycosyltransferase [Pontibacter sp. E15-1]